MIVGVEPIVWRTFSHFLSSTPRCHAHARSLTRHSNCSPLTG